ncbi:MAG: hypothetical protein GKC10_03715 [Methanosarcinales archaeon]|nr:hypothetical protein [Methanosarcinales archaeon]
MTEAFVETEVDRTKSRWVANVLREFGRPRTTARALFYYALRREASDYPICGGFVGEIRVTRPYHVSDGSRLLKWLDRARQFGYVDGRAILDEVPGEHIYLPEEEVAGGRSPDGIPSHLPYHMPDHISGRIPDRTPDHIPDRRESKPRSPPHRPGASRRCRLELWLDRSALNPLLLPVCREMGITLVSVEKTPSRDAILALLARRAPQTVILCLCDLSIDSFEFEQRVAQAVGGPAGLERGELETGELGARELGTGELEASQLGARDPGGRGIQVRRLGLTPRQVGDLKLPLVPGRQGDKKEQDRYKKYVKPEGISPRMMAELDALEVHYPGGMAAFVRDELSPVVRECLSAK